MAQLETCQCEYSLACGGVGTGTAHRNVHIDICTCMGKVPEAINSEAVCLRAIPAYPDLSRAGLQHDRTVIAAEA